MSRQTSFFQTSPLQCPNTSNVPRKKDQDPVKDAFNDAIVSMIVGLSKHLGDYWSCVKNVVALFKIGGVEFNAKK